jgi:octaprenyl-diphosphate synthase
MVQASGGIDYARRKMEMYRDEALELLRFYPASAARDAMEQLVHYAIDRKY